MPCSNHPFDPQEQGERLAGITMGCMVLTGFGVGLGLVIFVVWAIIKTMQHWSII
jgi:hypothetical protein